MPSAAPRPSGKISPATLMKAALLAFIFILLVSISRPTKNKKNTSPMFAVSVSNGMLCDGNMLFVKFGILPMIDGPSITPPITSAITRG